MMDLDSDVIAVLDALERREAELLSWGIVDGGFTGDELYHLVDDILFDKGSVYDPEDVVDALVEHKLLFEFPSSRGEYIWRTRMAEAVRLFSSLRLLTPWQNWRESPSLVSDFRFDIKPRLYPERNWPLDEAAASDDQGKTVLGSIRKEHSLTDLQESVVRALVHPIQSDGTRARYELSEFQVTAIRRVLSDVAQVESRGMIVSAGTGTGKTLAFYIPAFMRVAASVRHDQHYAKVIALYPRRELLKDQLSEAYKNARRLDKIMSEAGKRKITIGAYYGDTPKYAWWVKEYDMWPKASNKQDYLCPFLRCPKCDSALSWRMEDIEKDIERLECTGHQCSHVVEENEVRLTRQSMLANPPDFVFTTTEMMNRLMSEQHHCEVIGVGTNDPAPEMVLLDEVHTYSGTHGAQVAHLLRRWHKAVKDRGRPQYTGLSATLRSARDFFATLTNLNPADVEAVAPSEEAMTESESVEYQLALRGDPVSGTALLSTSIQALMLLRRVLDPINDTLRDSPSAGLYGQRAFAFTDNLDVINRFYHNFLDAEGRHPDGWEKHGRSSYAGLRSQYEDNEAERLRWGQSWRMAEEIGHPRGLKRPLEVDRTSSQDAGVTQRSDVVVATASLEVGYNDRRVGGILQHKAPRDMASFLQRKGRAGRPPKMRPWTVVVLSDYGRDRMAYQGYDQLFSPVIEERSLPVTNRFVLRMQAVFALMDWLAQESRSVSLPGGSVWKDFSKPVGREDNEERRNQRQRRQNWLADKVESVLDGGEDYDALRTYIEDALDIDHADAHAVFWRPPRALMTAVLPTILRRLETDWNAYGPNEGDQDSKEPEDREGAEKSNKHEEHDKHSPLPEFIPSALFGDLNLPEVRVTVPVETHKDQDRHERHPMPVAQAMREYAPGRVSRRFGIQSDADTHWIAPASLDPNDKKQDLEVSSFARTHSNGSVQVQGGAGRTIEYPCLRPTDYRASQVPSRVRHSSNASLDWHTQICPFSHGDIESVSSSLQWQEIIPEVGFHTHSDHTPLEVRRFALASETETTFTDDTEDLKARLRFMDGDRPVALGFSQEVDGIVFRVNKDCSPQIDLTEKSSTKARSLRTAYFQHRLQSNEALDDIANQFQRDWLYQLYLAAISHQSMVEDQSLENAFQAVSDRGLGDTMLSVLDKIFQALPEEAESDDRRAPVRESLEALCRHETVQQVIKEEAKVLWQQSYHEKDWDEWLRRRYLSSLGKALLEACNLVTPDAEVEELLLDIDAGPRPPGAVSKPDDRAEIWITERTVGGGGVVEQVAREYRKDPRRFFQLVESTLSASDFELVDTELEKVLDLAVESEQVQQALSAVRNTKGVDNLKKANAELRDILTDEGILGVHPVYAGLQNRILRPGSSQQTDILLHDLLRGWKEEEKRLGIELDARVFAYAASQSESCRSALRTINREAAKDADWRFQTVYSLLWLRGRKVRERALETYNPYADLPPGDRLIVRDVIPQQMSPVHTETENWDKEMEQRLAERGIARVASTDVNRAHLQEVVLSIISDPVDVDVLRLYPRLAGIEREEDGFVATFTLPEVMQ